MNNKFEQNNIDENKKNKMVAITFSILSIFVLIGIGMAYFSATVVNTNNEKFSTETSTIALKFDDGDNGISGTLNLGESIIKKFTLENTGTKDAYAQINWVDLCNWYFSNSLTYTLEQSTSENGTYELITNNNVPVPLTPTNKETVPLAQKILVPVNTKYYYKLTITLNNLDINQNSDRSAVMNSKFGIVEDNAPLAVDTVRNLVQGSPTNSTDVITKPTPNAGTWTIIYSDTGQTYDETVSGTESLCREILNDIYTDEPEVAANLECINTIDKWGVVINPLTSQYEGLLYHVKESESECNAALQQMDNSEELMCQKITDENAINYLPDQPFCTNTLAYDGTADNNLRYVGANPCNYVEFNDDIKPWRIVGIMNNVENNTGKKETRIKLVRTISLGSHSWDTSDLSINSGDATNDWVHSDLRKALNYTYLNYHASTWFNGTLPTGNYKLGGKSQSLIGPTKWNLGGISSITTASQFYSSERETNVWGSTSGQTCNDDACPRETSWIGRVALPYPSDYGFSVGGSVRSTCLAKNLNTYNTDNCNENVWLPKGWLLSPSSSNASLVYQVNNSYNINNYYVNNKWAVYPVVYLNSNVSFSSGHGTEQQPYVLN